MITVERVRKTFGSVVAVEDVSFTAPDGQITGILGPNGAGKTTTMRMVSSLVRPDSGSVSIDTVDVVNNPAGARARVGVLPDARGLYPRLSARENIAYFGALQGLDGRALARAVERLIEQLDLNNVADRRVDGFSQGERAKVAVARALVHDPQNVLLDEPTNGLDVMSTRAMRGLVQSLRDQGRAVLFSSHIMQEVSALCDSVVVVARGKVVAHGTAEQLLEQTGCVSLEEAFVHMIGSEEGLLS